MRRFYLTAALAAVASCGVLRLNADDCKRDQTEPNNNTICDDCVNESAFHSYDCKPGPGQTQPGDRSCVSTNEDGWTCEANAGACVAKKTRYDGQNCPDGEGTLMEDDCPHVPAEITAADGGAEPICPPE